MVNVSKMRMIQKLTAEIERFQDHPYGFNPDPTLRYVLHAVMFAGLVLTMLTFQERVQESSGKLGGRAFPAEFDSRASQGLTGAFVHFFFFLFAVLCQICAKLHYHQPTSMGFRRP